MRWYFIIYFKIQEIYIFVDLERIMIECVKEGIRMGPRPN